MSGRDLIDRVSAVPGVTSVSLTTDVPLTGAGSAAFYSAEGDQTSDAQTMPRAFVHRVSPDFFGTMGMPLLAGRTFLESERTAALTWVIVSEGVVRRFWPGQDPIGKRIKLGPPTSTNPWLTIVGVVPETKYRALPVNPTNDPDLYLPAIDLSPQPLIIRTSVPPASVLPSVRTAVTRGYPGVTLFATSTMSELVDTQTSASRFTMWVLGLFAATALLLSAIGIYGVMAYLVTQRTREFGIRIALGATRGEIVGAVLTRGAMLIGVGAAIGLALAVGLSRLFGSMLYEVTTIDLATAVAVLVLIAAAILACVVPAIRATRVDPAVALRTS
jgi:predicted permease